jgi:hypothetical protein
MLRGNKEPEIVNNGRNRGAIIPFKLLPEKKEKGIVSCSLIGSAGTLRSNDTRFKVERNEQNLNW